MDKITTPTLQPVVCENVPNVEMNTGAVVRDLVNEKIVLMVGQFQHRLPEDMPYLKSLLVSNVAGAEKVIAELKRLYRRLPAAIVFRVGNGFETGLSQWQEFFALQPAMMAVPFFLLTEKVTDRARSLKKDFPFVDDIITRESLKDLSGKIEFVTKFKNMQLLPPEPEPAALPVSARKGQRLGYVLKRTFDITAASTALVLASPLMLLIAIAIKLESKGNIFYASPRAGKNYKIFKFYKFRTMVADADKQLAKLKHLNQYGDNAKGAVFYKVSNDPRITRLGNFLRNTSLDEIPQLFNVLKGDMSLVGNRPLPLYEAATLTTDEWAERFIAPAGITGLWQISKRGKKEMSAEERIELDINYAHRNSFAYDMWLIMNTPKALIQKDNV
ncbi:Sugar transferase involved in LPS biosynthesis (colanic, teichoic acid) [Chitinophaga eiseniae]|uniref:Sugar transferase involved in LPS biosynthesis (Colanic, teichoic acid) n=1 Tax=Chitinophaga eiseniae TaxID=634771 RepID=A0A1T4U0J1_9BACT|nr:sugar transferase [Chitinophaga eiseniae]SKA46051.1 Sugar transferase involved in LPS biosynthesis (colanic, teichoic acid) [Chitinophaga eiseniae]